MRWTRQVISNTLCWRNSWNFEKLSNPVEVTHREVVGPGWEPRFSGPHPPQCHTDLGRKYGIRHTSDDSLSGLGVGRRHLKGKRPRVAAATERAPPAAAAPTPVLAFTLPVAVPPCGFVSLHDGRGLAKRLLRAGLTGRNACSPQAAYMFSVRPTWGDYRH